MKKTTPDDSLERALTDLYQADVPAGYRASWRDAVQREEPSEMKPSPGYSWLRRAALPLAAAAVLIVGTAVTGIVSPRQPSTYTGSDSAQTSDTAYTTNAALGELGYVANDMAVLVESSPMASSSRKETAYAPAPAAEYAADFASGTTAADWDVTEAEETADSRKIIRTVSLTLSSTAFEQDYAAILSLTQGAGGYASSVSTYEQQVGKRTASFELRIPAESLDGFLNGLGGIGRTTDRYETATDMTTQYTDTELRLKTQQDKMTRLQELMLKAETVEDLLSIESEIADTQYWIDSLQTSLRTIDRQVEYATVSVYLREQTPADTAVAEDLTVGERLFNGLKASLAWLGGFFENMLVFLIAASPVLVTLTAAYLIVRAVRKHRKSGKQS